MLTFLRHDYRDTSLVTLYLVVIGIIIPKNQMNRIIIAYKHSSILTGLNKRKKLTIRDVWKDPNYGKSFA